jgi:hypothetical protein
VGSHTRTARFRAKKKQQSISARRASGLSFRRADVPRRADLERIISDLNGRADELEREAADLRRENGWLKEIVMLKGRAGALTGPGAQLGPPPDMAGPSGGPH